MQSPHELTYYRHDHKVTLQTNFVSIYLFQAPSYVQNPSVQIFQEQAQSLAHLIAASVVDCILGDADPSCGDSE